MACIDEKYHSLIARSIKEQLEYEPTNRKRNRKPLERSSAFGPAMSVWELRFGPDNRFRVFYVPDVDLFKVKVVAVGVKIRDQLFIGGEVFFYEDCARCRSESKA